MLESIRRRLTLGYTGILALILLLFGAVVVAAFSQQATAQQDKDLTQKAEAEAEDLLNADKGYGRIKAATKSDIAVVAVPPDGSATSGAAIDLVGDDSSHSSYLGLPFEDLARESARSKTKDFETVDGPDGEAVRVLSRPITASGEVVAVVQAAQSRGVVRETVGRLVAVLALVGLGAIFLSLAGGLYMSRRAMRPAREAFERQRAFVADASHELKTPLALVRVNAELVQKSPTNPRNAGVVQDQLSEIDRMDALLSDLLLLARLDAGKLDVEKKPFDLATVVAEAADRFAPRAAAEGKRLHVEVPEDGLPARGDAERAAQILAALLDNALRHTPKGGRVALSGSQRDGRAIASVTDEGPGMSPEQLRRVFERFYRAEAARTRKGGGTGLGLSIARDLARAQGGQLTAGNAGGSETTSGTGGGAVFRLELPAS